MDDIDIEESKVSAVLHVSSSGSDSGRSCSLSKSVVVL